MAKRKTKKYLDRNEMLGAFFLVRAWGNHAKVARALGVSSGAISDLMRDISSSLAGNIVERKKHGEDLKVAVKMLSSHPAIQREQVQLPLNPAPQPTPISPLERLNKILVDLPEILEERVLERTAELRNELKEAREAKPAFK